MRGGYNAALPSPSPGGPVTLKIGLPGLVAGPHSDDETPPASPLWRGCWALSFLCPDVGGCRDPRGHNLGDLATS